MFTHIMTLTRSSTDIPWYSPPAEYKTHIQSNYMDTGIMLSRDSVESADGLTRTITTVFAEKMGYYAIYIVDPTIQEFNVGTVAYYSSKGINVSVTVETDELHA